MCIGKCTILTGSQLFVYGTCFLSQNFLKLRASCTHNHLIGRAGCGFLWHLASSQASFSSKSNSVPYRLLTVRTAWSHNFSIQNIRTFFLCCLVDFFFLLVLLQNFTFFAIYLCHILKMKIIAASFFALVAAVSGERFNEIKVRSFWVG